MPDVLVDASVAFAWFYAEGERDVASSRRLLHAGRTGAIDILILDLTSYEVVNALMTGRPRFPAADAVQAVDVLRAMRQRLTPEPADLHLAARLAEQHGLTFYDAAYAAVAGRRGARLATLDRQLLAAGLGQRPSEIVRELGLDDAESLT